MKQKRPPRRPPKAPRAAPVANVTWLTTGHWDRQTHLILAHGAGAPMTNPYLEAMAALLDARGITVHRFEFDYMAARRAGGARRPAPRAETLVGAYHDAILSCRAGIGRDARLFIGGKSMGGRIACLTAAELQRSSSVDTKFDQRPKSDQKPASAIHGVVVLGFPLHPPRKPQISRANALAAPTCPVLVAQGTRDPFGGREAFAELALPPTVRIHWIEDGDHDLTPRRSSGRVQADALREAADAIAAFTDCGASRPPRVRTR